ncbi:MAG TPA: PLP-dependent aminotransferase family protein [Baekduia sp.]|uniref:aminotransferase-like domain-containing protein n=1 Tax=Baekduia sp. TaxID=2600305 RepID=UPI002C555A99|nr:PLP-dependent aminotransferase family protein [Baekduia sp.]HMJ37036.1 PLP-dependent aminotransferase family protein [Baekduia sp.]
MSVPQISTAPPPAAARLRDVASSPVREILALTQRPGVISFAGGLPAPELFDAPGLRTAFAAALADDRFGRTLQYSTTEGDPALRAAIAQRLGSRGLPTGADDVLVTSGSQQALTLIAAVLIEPGDTVLVEEPSYLAALQCFQMAGARVVPIPCDDDGLDPEALPALVRRERPKLLYTVPTFHNPTGRTLPLERRRALAQAAARLGLWIVEDDPYGELRYRGEPVAPVASLPGAEDRTIALSTLSKVLVPGLRIGWLRAPAALRRALVVAKQAADLHTSTIDQAAAAHWLAHCDLDAHVAGLRAAYGPRRDALVDGLPETLPEGSRWTRPDGGMFVWVRLPDGWDADALLAAALEREVAFVPGWPFFPAAADRATLRLSFTTHTVAEIGTGLGRLRAAVDSIR